MKELLIIKDTPENKLSYYFLILFLVFLPFDRFYSEVVFITFLVHTIIHLNRQRLQRLVSRQNLLLTGVFLLNVASIAWTHDIREALKDTEHQLTLLLFPIVLSLTGLELRLYKKKLLTLFSLTCVILVLYLYADAIRIIWYYKLSPRALFSWSFVNHNFSAPIGLHATYFAMYIVMGVVSLFSFIYETTNRNSRLLYATGIAILLAGLVQLATKSVLIATLIIVVQVILFFMPPGIRRTRVIITGLVVMVCTFFVITRIGSFRKRYLTEFKSDLTEASHSNEILEPRIVRWRSALPVIRRSPLIGHGSGSEKRLLKDAYFENKLYDSYLHELNSHNQYLSFLIKTGVIGLVVYMITLSTGFLLAFRRRDLMFMAFMILISIVSASENILDVNKGIFFYAFIFSFFVKTGKPIDQMSRLTKR